MSEDVMILGTSEELWSPDDKAGPWALRLTFALVGGRPGVVGVELYAVDPEQIAEVAEGWPRFEYAQDLPRTRPITTAGMRVPLAEQTNWFLASTKRRAAALSDDDLPEHLRVYNERVMGAKTPRRPGRPPSLTRRHFEEVAAIYNEAFSEGVSPLGAIADKKHVSRSTAGKWATTCRRLGLLPRAVQGKAAGFPVARKRSKK